MSDLAARVASLSPVQRKLLEQRLKSQPSLVPAAEPIAVIGMGCRFPGAPDLGAYWRLIRAGRSAVSEVPSDRWNADAFYDPTGETPGMMSVRWAAFVENPDRFDPQFFGITPREAVRMDPQQRLLLEVAWEAMENAGRPAEELAGTRCGVFVGIGGNDYAKVCIREDDYYQRIDAHLGTGNALSIAANRVSYIFDLHGPSAAVDTACSSASLAIHFAVESLRRGESDSALAGGVNMILTPETTIAFSKARMLSPEGICRPFDARANGYVRGEGCGLVLLKRLVDAERDGDNILAIIRATAVNQDGRTSGISAPNSQSQVACIRAALAQAGLRPDDIDYIEAHGTGTPLGDPIEMMALAEIFAARCDSDPPCYVSSVKANVGHMETVSGVAGLIKTILLMQHDELVPQTNFEALNPHIKLHGTRLRIPTQSIAWPRADRRRIAGVSSFGFGGTNTHIVIEAPPPPLDVSENDLIERPLNLLKLSAKTEDSLRQQAAHLDEFLQQDSSARLTDVCWSANTAWSDFNHRAMIAATTIEELRDRLQAVAAGTNPAPGGVKQAAVRAIGRPNVAFLFTGQGSQYVDMGRRLYETQPIFRQAIARCDAVLSSCWNGESLTQVLYPDASTNGAPNLLDQTKYTQPALFALEYALAELWASWGVKPDIVLGHSVGEYAAACIAGVMEFDDGLRLIAERARLMQSVKRHGKMAVVFASRERVAKEIKVAGGNVVIAVLNGPENIVISGVAEDVDRLVTRFETAEIQVKPLNVSHAFHSPLMDEMLDEFERFAEGIQYQRPHVPWAANLTGQLLVEAPTARYWRDHLRNAVQFEAGMERIAESQPAIIIEIGPTSSLLGMGRRCVPKLDTAWLPSLREGQNDWTTISQSVSEYYVRGGRVDWRGWDQPWLRRRLLLPNYPFQRTSHWFKVDVSRRTPVAGELVYPSSGSENGERVQPLLGAPLSTVWTNKLYETRLSRRSPAFLADHVVQGSAVTPAAAYIEQGLAAASAVFGSGHHALEGVAIQQAMFLSEGASRRVQVSVAPEMGGEATFEVFSRAEEGDSANAWTMHASGTLVHESKASATNPVTRIDLDALRKSGVLFRSGEEFYDSIAQRGLSYGPAFRAIKQMISSVETAIAAIELPATVQSDAPRYHLHPVLGDALLQTMAGAVPLEKDGSFSPYTYMPVGIERVRIVKPIGDFDQTLYVVARRTSKDSQPSPERVEADVCLLNAEGDVLVAFDRVQVQRLGRGSIANQSEESSDWLYEIAWRESPPELSQPTRPESSLSGGTWLILADAVGVGRALATMLAEKGRASVLVEAGQSYSVIRSESTNGHSDLSKTIQLNPLEESQFHRLFDEVFGSAHQRCAGIVHLWSLEISTGDAKDDAALGCGGALQLLRALARAKMPKQPHVWFVTAGAQSMGHTENELNPASVGQSPLLGFVRVAAMEMPDFHPRLVDLDRKSDNFIEAAATTLIGEIAHSSNDGEVAYRENRRYVARLVRANEEDSTSPGEQSSRMELPAGPYQLRITQAGSFDALKFLPFDPATPAPGQVEIEVHATGLNFSDVLKALGLYPGIKDEIVPLGIEASGVVSAVGEGVNRFRIGDEVLGVVPYAFASHARTAEYALVPKPKYIDHDAAATIPITFLTAYYGLARLAQLQPGERVLIHAGAGGVGLAAIQIAQHIGAEIFATAGSSSKHEFLKSLGVKYVYSSRTVAFAEQILADTNREGVDIVLNSLPGEAITKSLSILRAYGRFLEIGKTDIYQNRMIGLLPFQDNLSYFAIDLDRMLRQRPDYIRILFAEVMEHFGAGHYKPLIFTRFEAPSTIDSFRFMSQRKNIGKVVVALDRPAQTAEPASGSGQRSQRGIRSDGTYLITGGLGALGLRVAKWFAEQGAGAVALVARRPPSEKAQQALSEIESTGTQVAVLQADVTDSESLCSAIAGMSSALPPIRGVVHAAGVLADGILTEMTPEQLDRALAPKARGAWNLHEITKEMPLDLFVMFSSVASVLGSPGQANYAAGNAYLDALAHARHAAGLPATSINWGPWSGSGMAVEAGFDEAHQGRGMKLIDPQDGLNILGKLLDSSRPQVAVMNVQWPDLFKLLGSRRPAMLAELAAEAEVDRGHVEGGRVDHAFRERLQGTDEAARQSLVEDYIRQELARIMGVDPQTLETNQPLSTFGLDSLLALELKNNLEGRLDFTLPMAKLMEGPSIASLAAETSRLIAGGPAPTVEGGSTETSDGDEEVSWTPLVQLQTGTSYPPLFLLPGLGGDARYYADLVQGIDDDRPIYIFRPRGLDQDLPPHTHIDETMRDYVAAVREIQPSGPYYLAGWSTGGTFAFGLAEALERAGEEVALVALMDSPMPSLCADIDVEDEAHFFCDLVNFANHLSGPEVRIDYDKLAALPRSERLKAAIAEACATGMLPAEMPESFVVRLVEVGRANVRVLQSYRPTALAAPVVFFAPESREALAQLSGRTPPSDEDLGWSREIGQVVELRVVAGDHFTMMSGDSAATICRELSQAFERSTLSQRSS